MFEDDVNEGMEEPSMIPILAKDRLEDRLLILVLLIMRLAVSVLLNEDEAKVEEDLLVVVGKLLGFSSW